MSPTAFIQLTKDQATLVDEADYATLIAIGRWCYSNSGYAVHYCKDEFGKRKTLYMHRIIMQRVLYQTGIPSDMQVDHRNMNRIDNRRLNLRLATRSQNQAHKDIQVNNTSQFKGVTLTSGRWAARIRFEGKRLHLGCFADGREAALMYDAASRLLYQDFAGCNFPHLPTPPYIEQKLRDTLDKRGFQKGHLVLK